MGSTLRRRILMTLLPLLVLVAVMGSVGLVEVSRTGVAAIGRGPGAA